MASPRTLGDATAIDHSLTDISEIFDRSDSDDDPTTDNFIEHSLYVINNNYLTFRYPICRKQFWQTVNKYHLDNLYGINWSYRQWEDKILEDLELLRDQLAYYNFDDPWPDVADILKQGKAYPNIKSIKIVNLSTTLHPRNLIDFLKLFPSLRKIIISRPADRDWLTVDVIKQQIRDYKSIIQLEFID